MSGPKSEILPRFCKRLTFLFCPKMKALQTMLAGSFGQGGVHKLLGSNKSTGKETGKTHLCAMVR